MAEMGCTGLTAELMLQMGLDAASGRQGVLDLIEAHKWFNLAAFKGNEEAVQLRAELSEQMSSEDVALAQKAARHWLSLH
ncbi:hypothetical protein E1162_03690 [Rhodobacteraceae bacterium RKSG542]|nr:hypothetical protein [Pseudovibrio flavus]